jgi:RNA polymerase sigma-70 factor (ECF subfamily)
VRDADREDLVHEVFLKVQARMADYDTSRPIRPWLFGFAYRVAADHHRLARHRFEVFGEPREAVAASVPADERVELLEERNLVLEALLTLELDRRAVVILHDIDDMPVPEIARMLEVPLNTAYSRLRLAREQLATAVVKLRATRTSGKGGR